MRPSYRYNAVIRSVYDGDTVRADIDLGCFTWIHNEPLRLAGIDAPELRGATKEHGRAARDWLREAVLGQNVVVETERDKRGKYGRLIATIWHEKQDATPNGRPTLLWVNVNEAMVAAGMAVRREY